MTRSTSTEQTVTFPPETLPAAPSMLFDGFSNSTCCIFPPFVGCFGGIDAATQQPSTAVFLFNLSSSDASWTLSVPLPSGLFGPSLVASAGGNRLVLCTCCGYAAVPKCQLWQTEYDVARGIRSWTLVAEFDTPKVGASLATTASVAYVVGGVTSQLVQRYHIIWNETWSPLTPIALPVASASYQPTITMTSTLLAAFISEPLQQQRGVVYIQGLVANQSIAYAAGIAGWSVAVPQGVIARAEDGNLQYIVDTMSFPYLANEQFPAFSVPGRPVSTSLSVAAVSIGYNVFEMGPDGQQRLVYKSFIVAGLSPIPSESTGGTISLVVGITTEIDVTGSYLPQLCRLSLWADCRNANDISAACTVIPGATTKVSLLAAAPFEVAFMCLATLSCPTSASPGPQATDCQQNQKCFGYNDQAFSRANSHLELFPTHRRHQAPRPRPRARPRGPPPQQRQRQRQRQLLKQPRTPRRQRIRRPQR